MDFLLDEVEARVLGALIEKDLTTPEYYPLSLNALVNACNQKTNREPVTAYDGQTVEEAIERLRSKRMAASITGPGIRVEKFAQRLGENFNFGTRELAVLAVLMLRGPQTLGELRDRTERMHRFDDVEGVEATLSRLAEREPAPLVKKLPKAPGTKEPRYAHLFCGDIESFAPPVVAAPAADDRFERLEAEVEALRREVETLRQSFDEFRRQFDS